MALPDETARDGSSETTAPPAVQAFDGSEPCASVGPAACDAGDIRCQTADSESETTRFAVAGEDPDDSASDDLRLIPGASVGDGRYRLLRWHGGLEHLQFWQALDTTLHRQVALTLVDPDGRLPDEQIQAIVSRTLSLSRLDMPGIGRVLQVVRAAPGAIVVAEWIRGATLAEVADTNPPPVGAARAMQSLAAAAEAAHRGGTALSIDHPSRVRVSIEGHVALAFPATMPDATREADLRGIGACLYALLVDRWPLPRSGAPSALAPAQVETEVRPKDPTAIDADIPFQISAVATGSLRGCGGIRSATTLLSMLEQATAEADPAECDTRARKGFPVRLPRLRATRRRSRWPMEAVRGTHRGPLIGLAAGAAAIVAVVLLAAAALSHIMGLGITGISLEDLLGLHASASAPPPVPAAAGRSLVVKPVKATVFSPRGEADNPQSAGLAIDGDPATAWSTDTYLDAVPFPGFKDGVGLLLQLVQPVTPSSVTVDLDSAGTVVQIRSSPTATPAQLDDTAALTAPMPMQPGHNSIPVTNPTPTSNVLVWIATLGTMGGKSRADISEVGLQAAS